MKNELKYLFPKTNKTSELKSDYEGKYSISRPDDAKTITKYIRNKLSEIGVNNDVIITDATAGVGGDTISFCKEFSKVFAIEINKERHKYLINNLRIYDLNNYETINDDMMKIIPNMKQDVIFIDPPWGGKGYINYDRLDVYIDDIEISKISKQILDNNYCKLLVLKLPYNYNMDNMKNLNGEYVIENHIIRNKILLLLINKSLK